MFGSNMSDCIICCCTLQSEVCEDPKYFTSVFDVFCRLLEINLIEGMQWNFEQDDIPFCHPCYSAVEKLKGLYDQLNVLQMEINDVLQITKHKILTSGSIPNNNISNELDEIDRVTYIRQQAVKGIQLENPGITDEIDTPQENTSLLIKLEMNEEENNENTSFLYGIKEETECQEQIDVFDPLDGGNNESYIETPGINETDLISGDAKGDSDLLFIKSEDNDESFEASQSTSDVIIPDAEDIYKCLYCEKTFPQKVSLTLHLKQHLNEDRLKCDVCNKSFSLPSILKKHKRSHDGEKPYKCDACEKCFSMPQGLVRHKRIHTGEKPFECDVCGKCFRDSSNLNCHRRIHTVELPYNCELCRQSFKEKGELVVHALSHNRKNPLTCDVCQQSFTRSCDLTRHKSIHTADRPFKCDVCDKGFKRKEHLVDHKRIHNGERPFMCQVCGLCFARSSNLSDHKRIHREDKSYNERRRVL